MTRQATGIPILARTDTVNKVFLATPADLQSNGIGALFLRDLIASHPDMTFTIHEEPRFFMGATGVSRRLLTRLLRAASTRLPGFHSARLRWFRSFLLGSRVAAIAAAADAAKAECIWVTASSVEMIWIAEQLAASGHDVRVTVWDTPEHGSLNSRLDSSLLGDLIDSFGSLLQQARAVSVIGHAMQEEYLKRYGVQSEIIRHGIDADLSIVGRKPPTDGPVRIVFAGTLYAKEEWNSFTQALDAANWQLAGRPVLLHFMGRFPLSGARKPEQVVFLGEKPFDEALQIMSAMDIGYLPYWFDEKHKLVAQTSFPGKLSAYTAAGLAVFHHAPPYTEATTFLERYPFGLACPSLEADDIMHILARLADLAATDECCTARVTAVQEELARAVMAPRFRRFLAATSAKPKRG